MVRRWRERMVLYWVPLIGYWIVSLIYATNKKRFIGTPLTDDKPVVVACWHEHLLIAPYCWRFLRSKSPGKSVFVIASQHKDGEYITRLVGRQGIGAIRGSSSRGGAKALLEAVRKLKGGDDLAIMPDGPRGPRHTVAPGVVALAQKGGCNIVPMRYTASRYWRLKSWDRFMVPKPFGTITLEVGEPFSIHNMEIDAAKELIQARLGIPTD